MVEQSTHCPKFEGLTTAESGAPTFSIMTFSITTLSIMTLRIMTLRIMTLRIMTLSIMTLSIMTLRILVLFEPLSINKPQHYYTQYNDTQHYNTVGSLILIC